MRNWMRAFWMVLFATMAGVTFVGCDVKEGPAEEVGEELDEAADEIEDAVDDAN